MKIKYDSDADIIMIVFADNPPIDAVEEPGGVILSYDENGSLVSLEILNASKKHIIKKGELNITFLTGEIEKATP